MKIHLIATPEIVTTNNIIRNYLMEALHRKVSFTPSQLHTNTKVTL